MKKVWMALVICAAMSGCHSSSPGTGGPGSVIGVNDVPAAVMSAFDAEYPYAKMTKATQNDTGNGTANYTIDYVRSDGSTGKVVYSQSGAMISGGN